MADMHPGRKQPMNPIPAILTFFAGALLGGALADGADAFALLFGLGVTGGAFSAPPTHGSPTTSRAGAMPPASVVSSEAF
jgi:hypothetical protein